MSNYRVIFEDPDFPEEPAKILVPAPEWLEQAMLGLLAPIWVHHQLKDAEELAIAEGRHTTFKHNPEHLALQFTAPRIDPLTEEEAIEYLIMKDIPKRVWAQQHNRQMFKIVRTEQVPSDRTFRDAWRLST